MQEPSKVTKVLKIVLFMVILLVVSALLVLVLWNWLMPSLFELRQINLLEALGLLVLSRILFGGFRGRRLYRGWQMRKRWKQMTPEEREKFREGWGHSSGD